MIKDTPFLSIVIPTYNEESIIASTLSKIREFLNKRNYIYEIIIVDDGSTDSTVRIIEGVRRSNLQVRILMNNINRGKGFSVKRGILEAKGRYILFTDADLPVDIRELDKALGYLQGEFDIVIASRRLEDSEGIGRESSIRKCARFILSIIANIFICKHITDSQCGFKCFTRFSARKIFSSLSINSYGFDLEVLFIANKFLYKIKEIPARWICRDTSKVKLFRDGVGILKDLMKIRINSLSHPL